MSSPSYTYSLTNSTTADASQVMQDFNDILNGVTDGTKDLSISALTCAGTTTLNGHVNIGNASADDLTITASLASTLPIKTTNSYDIGSSTLGLRALYLGANSQTTKIIGSASMSATWTLTLPVSAGTANYFLQTNGSGVTTWTNTFTAPRTIGVTAGAAATAGDVGEYKITTSGAGGPWGTTTLADTWTSAAAMGTLDLEAGAWIIGYNVSFALRNNGGSTITIGGGVRLYNSTDAAAVTNTVIGITHSMGAGDLRRFPGSRQMFLDLSGTKTFRLENRCTHASASADVFIDSTDSVSASLTDPDNNSYIWALRVR